MAAALVVQALGCGSGDTHRSTTTGLLGLGLTEAGRAGAVVEVPFLTGLPEACMHMLWCCTEALV